MQKTNNAKTTGVRKEREAWHPFMALLIAVLVAAFMTYLIPAGEFERTVGADGITRVDPSSFHFVEQSPTSLLQLFTCLYKGFQNGAGIIACCIFIMGGFGVLQRIGLMDALIKTLARSMKGKSMSLMTIIVMTTVAINHAFTGCRELDMVFIPLMIPLCIAMGYDTMTAVIIIFVGSAAGFTCAMANPAFTAIAHNIAQLPIYSAMGYRAGCTIIMLLIGYFFVMRYINRIKKDPSLSVVKDLPIEQERRRIYGGGNFDIEDTGLTNRLKAAALIFAALFILMIVGFLKLNFGYSHLAAVWLAVAIFPAIVAGYGPNKICKMWIDGVSENAAAWMIMMLAQAVLVILQDGMITDTIIFYLAKVMTGMGSVTGAVALYLVQSLINFPIPSGSGQAAVTMPIIVPLADLTGVTRQVACLASQFGDGLTNYVYPVNGILMAAIAASKISYKTWMKWFLPLLIVWFFLLIVFVAFAQIIHLGPM